MPTPSRRKTRSDLSFERIIAIVDAQTAARFVGGDRRSRVPSTLSFRRGVSLRLGMAGTAPATLTHRSARMPSESQFYERQHACALCANLPKRRRQVSHRTTGVATRIGLDFAMDSPTVFAFLVLALLAVLGPTNTLLAGWGAARRSCADAPATLSSRREFVRWR
jgi:hypothetical protein